jgi:hypothetical protein
MASAAYNWNVLTSLAAFPCAEPSPLIFAATFIPAVAPALLEYATFGCRDVLKFRLGRGTPCGRKMAAQVVKAIPPAFADGVGKLLKFEARFSLAGQIFMIADLVGDTLARWDTLAYQMSGCPDANNITTYDLVYSHAIAVLPNIPTAIGGAITNVHGDSRLTWPNGCIVPPGWYAQMSYELEAQPLFAETNSSLQMWIRDESASGYDFPATKYPAGYPGQSKTGQLTQTIQNSVGNRSKFYSFQAMATATMITTDFKASVQISEFPPTDWSLNALGCLRNLDVEHVPDPLGTNRKANYPTLVDKAFRAVLPKPVHGPPGGKPRKKD